MRIFRLLLLSLILVIPSQVFSASWYVDNAESGAEDGTSWTDAWHDPGDIVWGGAGVGAGDTVYISGGNTSKVYATGLNTGASGTSGSPIYVTVGANAPISAGHAGSVIFSAPTGAYGSGIFVSSDSYFIFDGEISGARGWKIYESTANAVEVSKAAVGVKLRYLTIDKAGNYGIYYEGDTGRGYDASFKNEIGNCWVHDSDVSEIYIQWETSRATEFDHMSIHDCKVTEFHGDGIKIDSDSVSIYANTIGYRGIRTNDHTDGIQGNGDWRYWKIYNNSFINFYRSDDPGEVNSYIRYGDAYNGDSSENIFIFNNLFAETGTGVPSGGDVFRGIEMAAQAPTVRNILIANNVLYRVPYISIILDLWRSEYSAGPESAQAGSIWIVNNIVIDSSRSGGVAIDPLDLSPTNTPTIGSWTDSVDIVVDYNIIYASSGVYTTNILGTNYSSAKTSYGVQDNDAGSPVDPSLGSNFAPDASGDPPVNAGVSLATIFTFDILNVTRPVGASWDIGAFEYSEGTASITITTPTSSATFTSTSSVLSVGGTASGSATINHVICANPSKSFTVTATGTSSWACTVPIDGGSNPITATVTDADTNTASDSLTVTREPTATISSPSSGSTYETSTTPISFSGVSYYGGSTISKILAAISETGWSSSTTPSGPTNAWSFNSVALTTGENTFVVDVETSPGDTVNGADQIVVTYSAEDTTTNNGSFSGSCSFR